EGVRQPQVVHILRPAELLKKFGQLCGPSTNGLHQRTKHGGRSFTSAPHDSISYVQTIALADWMSQQISANEVARIGHEPILAGLNKEVVPEGIQILANIRSLFAYDPQKRQQRLPLFQIIDAVLTGYSVIQPLCILHRIVRDHVSTKPPDPRSIFKVPLLGS